MPHRYRHGLIDMSTRSRRTTEMADRRM
jgi:hypothetical protein